DHLGSIRQTVRDDGLVVSAQDYLPYGEVIASRSYNLSSTDEKYKFTEKERDNESGYDYFGARYYNSELGRWMSVDPLADKYPGWSPYNYTLGNPINATDPDGRWVNFLIGAAFGAVTDIAIQVAVNYANGDDLTDIDYSSVAVSAGAGAVGAGLATKVSKLGTLLKGTVEVTIDAAASAIHQQETTGSVNATDVLIDATVGQVLGNGVSNKVGSNAKSSGNGKVLANQADRKQRIANNATSRKSAKQKNANQTAINATNYVTRRSASAATASSQVGSTAVKVIKNTLTEEEKD
ncbi:MAG: RHS repeat-associated core domain-containing protein, partial [Bacteroidetes bacterium]|nr:RHS repeat-associated core domain-containing protein [Bacteroidota bacterium]